MAFKSGFCRLALSVLDKSLARRTLSSLPPKCDVRSSVKLPSFPPLIALQHFRAPSSQTNVIDPTLIKSPLSILDVPPILNRIDVPSMPVITTIRPTAPAPVEDPTKVIEKQAARLIVIRRRKMRRHKLRKLRKKMKYVWAKQRQKRELKKEKEFQAELMGKIREAEKFDPAAYAALKIEKANEVLIPKTWHGKRLPEFVIKELLEERNRKIQRKLEAEERRKNRPSKVADYKV